MNFSCTYDRFFHKTSQTGSFIYHIWGTKSISKRFRPLLYCKEDGPIKKEWAQDFWFFTDVWYKNHFLKINFHSYLSLYKQSNHIIKINHIFRNTIFYLYLKKFNTYPFQQGRELNIAMTKESLMWRFMNLEF